MCALVGKLLICNYAILCVIKIMKMAPNSFMITHITCVAVWTSLPKAFHSVTTTMYSNIAVTDSSLLPVSQSFTYCIAQNGGGGKTLVNQPFQSFGEENVSEFELLTFS